MRPRLLVVALVALAAPLVALGCTTYQDDLSRGQKYYEGNEHERALAVLRMLEHDLDSLKPEDRVKYFYYRGMTDYRLASDTYKVRPDARHWLGLAQAGEEETPSALSDEQTARVKEALDDLARDVYGGADNDDAATKKDDKKKDAAAPKKKSDDDEAAPKKKKKADDADDADTPKKKKKKSSDD